MTEPHILQVGPYPGWDQVPPEETFSVHKHFQADDKLAFLAQVEPSIRSIATRGKISRASNIDEGPLIEALESGILGSAALDILEGEPDLDTRFLDLPNVLLQPHRARHRGNRKAVGPTGAC